MTWLFILEMEIKNIESTIFLIMIANNICIFYSRNVLK